MNSQFTSHYNMVKYFVTKTTRCCYTTPTMRTIPSTLCRFRYWQIHLRCRSGPNRKPSEQCMSQMIGGRNASTAKASSIHVSGSRRTGTSLLYARCHPVPRFDYTKPNLNGCTFLTIEKSSPYHREDLKMIFSGIQ